MSNATMINEKVDLHYSPDDNGWYFQEYDYNSNDRVSQTFNTEQLALQAWAQGGIEWHKV